MTLRLFVADDSVTIQKVVSLSFAGEDVVVESAADGDMALDRIRISKPDIVLADVFMPGRNGYEVCAGIKEDPELAHTPVVLLVGAFEQFDELEASRVKYDACLTKPFDTSELIQTIRSLAGEKMPIQKSEMPAENDQTTVPGASLAQNAGDPGRRGLVSTRIWESFLGSGRILDLFDPATLGAAQKIAAVLPSMPSGPAAAGQGNTSTLHLELSEDVLSTIADKVVRRMSEDVIREVAWEVIPELSEIMIRRSLEEKTKP